METKQKELEYNITHKVFFNRPFENERIGVDSLWENKQPILPYQ